MPAITRRHALMTGAALSAATLGGRRAHAAYPDRPVKVVVPWAPGGSTDILARIVAERMREALGQGFVVENRPGASGNIGSEVVAKSPADGYTLLFGSMSTHAMNEALFTSMPFDGVGAFTPISLLAYVTNTMVVHPSVPAATVPEFIAYLRANPGRVAYASAGAGSTNHLCAALFAQATGTQMVHVPYRGGAPAVLDTVSGQTQLLFSAGTQTLEHVAVGKLRLLGVTEARRAALLPDVPTVMESLPGFEMAVWYGAFGPAGLPGEVTARLNAEINRALFLPDVRKRMADIGVEVANETPEAFARTLRADAERWGRVIRELGIKAG